ncbi:expansin-A1-like [Gossypium australe]|uniref:Expansin-A1-like n=1 Tax=Gossypium australe TaxID=47621 RepID=A0A5B6VAZ4_9ROSI|nr:expansin-A1-like [Gossypium australe]
MMEIGVANEINNTVERLSVAPKKSSWKRLVPGNQLDNWKSESAVGKRKFLKEDDGRNCMGMSGGEKAKRLKNEDMVGREGVFRGAIPWAVRRLRHLLKQHNPHLVFLIETKLDKKRMERVRRSYGFMNGIEVEVEGSQGGLCLAWKVDIKVTLRSFSKWHIDVIIKEDDVQEEWRFTGFYGSPYLKDKNLA